MFLVNFETTKYFLHFFFHIGPLLSILRFPNKIWTSWPLL